MHPGEKRLELTIAHHYTLIGLSTICISVCKRCTNCAVSKKQDKKYGLLPPKPTPEIIPWHTLCIDLVGPYKFGNEKKPKTYIEFHCMAMIDPATGFFDIVDIGQKTADVIANWLEIHCLSRYPWPMENAMDKGSEFAAEVWDTLKNKYGFVRKIITSQNPQSNSIIERCHKTLHNMICSAQIMDKRDLDEFFGFQGILAACRKAMNSTVHTTSRATPTQLVFGRDAMLDASFQADWQFIKEHKQRLILQNNKSENAKHTPHTYNVGDVVVVKAGVKRKHDTHPHLGPMRITKYRTMALSSSQRSPITAELSLRPGSSGILNCAWPDHPCLAVTWLYKIITTRLKSSRAAIRFHRSKPSI